MGLNNFNEESEKPEFIHKPSPVSERSFQIFQFHGDKNDYEPIGEYTVLDLDEKPELTETRLMNLLSIMNQRSRTFDLCELTQSRILFNIIPSKPDDINEKVIFRTYTGDGVSKENAMLTVKKGVFDEFS